MQYTENIVNGFLGYVRQKIKYMTAPLRQKLNELTEKQSLSETMIH